jgi:large subunit ribosomal protein L12
VDAFFMEYVYAALLLHKLKQNITEDSVKNVIQAAGVTPDDVRVKALVAALSEVQIDEALKAAPVAVAGAAAPAAASPASGGGGTGTTAGGGEAPPKEEEKKEEEALEGLSSLFGWVSVKILFSYFFLRQGRKKVFLIIFGRYNIFAILYRNRGLDFR